MRKNIDKDAAANSEGYFNRELLFCTDAAVVDYLNALLESEPALKMDFKDIHFVHQEKILTGNANIVYGNPMLFDSEISKMEADLLRSENENLKFKTELAQIDAQVLRTENNKLKLVKERLIAQLVELKEQLSTMRAENASMKKSAEAGSHQFIRPAITVNDEIESESTDLNTPEEKVADEKADSDSDLILQNEIPEQELEMEPAAVTEEDCIENNENNSPSEHERLFISGVTVQDNSAKKMSTSEMKIFSRENTSGGISRQNVQPASKVIKYHSIERNHTQPTGHIVKVVSPEKVPLSNNNNYEPNNHLNFMPQLHHVTETENNLEADVPASITNKELLRDVDDIDMPPAADPKVVMRKNVKSYEDLQKESGSVNTTEAGHTIIL